MPGAHFHRARRRLLLSCCLLGARAQTTIPDDDCTVPPSPQRLRSRPWFCEEVGSRTDTDDLALCLGEGHEHNSTGLCRGRWQ